MDKKLNVRIAAGLDAALEHACTDRGVTKQVAVTQALGLWLSSEYSRSEDRSQTPETPDIVAHRSDVESTHATGSPPDIATPAEGDSPIESERLRLLEADVKAIEAQLEELRALIRGSRPRGRKQGRRPETDPGGGRKSA